MMMRRSTKTLKCSHLDCDNKLIATYDLHNEHIVEIRVGRGYFLRIICDRGNNVGVSFGPSYKPEPDDDIASNVRFAADYYTAKYSNEPANLIIYRHVLEHSSKPRKLTTTMCEAVGDRRDVCVYVEVPNGNLSCAIRYAGSSFTKIVHTLPRDLLSRSSLSAVSRRATFKRDLEVNSSQSGPVRYQAPGK